MSVKTYDEKNSRTALTYGKEMVNKIKDLSILIFGMRGLGVEIAKNLILCSPHEVYIFDKEKVELNDLGSNFCLNEDLMKKNRDEAVLNTLQELNRDVTVKIFDENNNTLEKFDVYICTEIMDFNKIEEIEKKVNASNTKCFIYCGVMGLSGFIFENFGKNFIMKNENGEEPKTYFIKNITKSKKTEIKIDITNEDIELIPNNEIEISDVKGMIEINGKKSKILKIDDDTITIDLDSSNFKEYERQGIIKEIKQKKKFEFSSFFDNLKKKLNFPINYYYYYAKSQLDKILHTIIYIYSLNEFYYEYKKLPPLLNEFSARNLALRSKAMYLKYKNIEPFNKISYFDDELIFKMSKITKCEISPLCSLFGGIVAQESLKIIGNYQPIFQWYVENFMEILEMPNFKIKQNIVNSRYCEQIAIFGEEFQKKLENLNIFLIGAGALGCEYLKNFAMMGISTDKGLITVTDNDRIEISNLNRQFLFSEKDKSKFKSETACESVKRMNEKLKCKPYTFLVDENSEFQPFNESFWSKQHFIFSAVDSVKAREYIDSQCLLFKKKLIDSGTMGLKAKSNIVIPFYSKTLGERNFLNDDIKKIPYCTLKFYPSRIEHCIEWAKDKFLTYFNYDMESLKNLCSDFDEEFNKLKDEPFSQDKFNKVETLYDHIRILIKNNLLNCQERAIKEYYKIFNFEINELKTQNNIDDKLDDGSYFWNGVRKLPKNVFWKEDETNLKFIEYFSKFLSQCLCIEKNDDVDLEMIISNLENEENNFSNEQCENYLNYIKDNIKNINIEKIKKIKKIEFSKDNDDIIEFIMTAANLRAENYSIEKCDKLKTISVTGSIIPAVSTSTAAITGFNMLQFYKMIGLENPEKIDEINLNLDSGNFFKYKIPKTLPIKTGFIKINNEQKKQICVPEEFNIWTSFVFKGKIKFNDIITFIETKYRYKIIINSINSLDGIIIDKNNEKINENTLDEIYQSEKKTNKTRKIIKFEINAESGETKHKDYLIKLPSFIYDFSNIKI